MHINCSEIVDFKNILPLYIVLIDQGTHTPKLDTALWYVPSCYSQRGWESVSPETGSCHPAHNKVLAYTADQNEQHTSHLSIYVRRPKIRTAGLNLTHYLEHIYGLAHERPTRSHNKNRHNHSHYHFTNFLTGTKS